MKFLAMAALLLAAIAPSAARSAAPMTALQYYVGNWSCALAEAGHANQKVNLTYTMDENVLRFWVVIPKQGKMTSDYAFQAARAYDAKKGQYVETLLDNDGGWSVSTAKPWSGNKEIWYDKRSSDGQLGRGETTRTNQNSFVLKSFPTATTTKTNFTVTCTRSS